MCNRARFRGEPETLRERFGTKWLVDLPMDNRFNPQELVPKGRAWVLRANDRGLGVDVMGWDVLGGAGKWPMTNVRNLALPQWQRLAAKPENRCLIPLTEFAEWTPDKHPDHGIKGEMWFSVTDQPIFAVAGFWQQMRETKQFAMVTCDPNALVAPIHPKAMITVLEEADWSRWLGGSYDDAVALQKPYDASRMKVSGPMFPTRTTTPAPAPSLFSHAFSARRGAIPWLAQIETAATPLLDVMDGLNERSAATIRPASEEIGNGRMLER